MHKTQQACDETNPKEKLLDIFNGGRKLINLSLTSNEQIKQK